MTLRITVPAASIPHTASDVLVPVRVNSGDSLLNQALPDGSNCSFYDLAGNKLPHYTVEFKHTVLSGCGTWYCYPEAVVTSDGRYVITGSVATDGYTYACKIDLETYQVVQAVQLGDTTEVDDHNNPTFWETPEGNIRIWYSGHEVVTCWSGVCTGYDLSTFSATDITTDIGGGNITYPSPVWLADEGVSGTLYLFFRDGTSGSGTRYCCRSTDYGATWDTRSQIIAISGQSPYLFATENGTDRIDLVFSSANPNHETTVDLHHGYITGGSIYKTDGTLIGVLGTATPDETDYPKFADGAADSAGYWISGIATDADGNVFAVSTDGTVQTNLVNYWHKMTRSTNTWTTPKAIYDGSPVASGATYQYYPLGLELDPTDPNKVLGVSLVNNLSSISRYTTADDGATWSEEVLVSGEQNQILRPIVPKYGSSDFFVYMLGPYGYYNAPNPFDNHLVSYPPTRGGEGGVILQAFVLADLTASTDFVMDLLVGVDTDQGSDISEIKDDPSTLIAVGNWDWQSWPESAGCLAGATEATVTQFMMAHESGSTEPVYLSDIPLAQDRRDRKSLYINHSTTGLRVDFYENDGSGYGGGVTKSTTFTDLSPSEGDYISYSAEYVASDEVYATLDGVSSAVTSSATGTELNPFATEPMFIMDTDHVVGVGHYNGWNMAIMVHLSAKGEDWRETQTKVFSSIGDMVVQDVGLNSLINYSNLYWACDETTGTSVADTSGDGSNTGAGNSTVTKCAFMTTEFGGDEQTRGLSLDGVDERFTINSWPAFSGNTFTLAITVDTEFAAGAEGWLISAGNTGSATQFAGISIQQTTGYVLGKWRNNANSVTNITGSTAINDGDRHTIVFTSNGGEAELWVDGVLEGTTTLSALPITLDVFTLGALRRNTVSGYVSANGVKRVLVDSEAHWKKQDVLAYHNGIADSTPTIVSSEVEANGNTVAITLSAATDANTSPTGFFVVVNGVQIPCTTEKTSALVYTATLANGGVIGREDVVSVKYINGNLADTSSGISRPVPQSTTTPENNSTASASVSHVATKATQTNILSSISSLNDLSAADVWDYGTVNSLVPGSYGVEIVDAIGNISSILTDTGTTLPATLATLATAALTATAENQTEILSRLNLIAQVPLAQADTSRLRLIRGDAYDGVSNNVLTWTTTKDITGKTVRFTVRSLADRVELDNDTAGVDTSASTGTTASISLSSAATNLCVGDHKYDVEVEMDTNSYWTIARGTLTIDQDQTRHES